MSLTLCFCVIIFCRLQFSLAVDGNILQELQLVKDQIEGILIENTNLKQELHNFRRKNDNLEEKIKFIAAENTGLKNQLGDIVLENADLKGNFLAIREENADLKRRTLDLEHRVNYEYRTLMNNFGLLKENNQKLNRSKQSLNSAKLKDIERMQVLAMGREDHNKRDKVNEVHREVLNSKERRLLLPTPTNSTSTLIAFSAKVKSPLLSLGDNQDIPFETEDIDIGNSFHPHLGVFICPHTGMYAFFVTILTYPNKLVQVQIVKDGNPLAFGYSYGDSVRYGTGSTSVIVHLKQGEKVWVKVHGVNHIGTGNMIHPDYSSFMGFSLMLE